MVGTQRTLGGRYRLGGVIGRGGMSTVYEAEDLVLHRTVAIKVLAPALAQADPVWAERFQREARAVASLSHPGIAAVYDAGAAQDTRFIVMERVHGRSLDEVIAAEAPLAPARARRIAAQIADALAAAHAAGIVHRDIKPANVILAADDSIKLLDFGIARAAGSAALTATASVVGTAAYMAPEQADGHGADERSDLYALGCVLYAMLAGAPPFTGALVAVLHQHVHTPPPPLPRTGEAIPAALTALVDELLAKDPARRPHSAAEVRDRLLGADGATAATQVLRAPHRRVVPAWLLLAAAALIAAVAVALSSGGGGRTGTSGPLTRTTPSSTTAPAVTAPATGATPTAPTSTSAPAPAPPKPGKAGKPGPGEKAHKGPPPGHGGPHRGKGHGPGDGGEG